MVPSEKNWLVHDKINLILLKQIFKNAFTDCGYLQEQTAETNSDIATAL